MLSIWNSNVMGSLSFYPAASLRALMLLFLHFSCSAPCPPCASNAAITALPDGTERHANVLTYRLLFPAAVPAPRSEASKQSKKIWVKLATINF